MENNDLELRMYSITLYQLTGIQQAIQSYHATIEATQQFNNPKSINKTHFNVWAKNWKTVIILNGGSSITLNEHLKILQDNNIQCSYFHEPDLGNIMTAISFICDERVFNKIKYPDYINHELEYKMKQGIIGLSADDNDDFEYNLWIKGIGGEQNAFLRTFLKNFKLA